VTAPSFVGERVHECAVHSLVACSLLSPPSLLSSLSPLSPPSLTLSPLSHSLSSRARAHALFLSSLSLSPLSLPPFSHPPLSFAVLPLLHHYSLSLSSLALLSLSFLSLLSSPPNSLPSPFLPTYRPHHSGIRQGQSQGDETRIHIEKGSSDRGGYKLRAVPLKKSVDSDFYSIYTVHVLGH
jgi:hypothetical protein